eukprot:TRINITY_DN23558_c0_g1_i1.p1 TRINITY_DN23558_c0_g1~~TRINITY_DN23558_c0_g1_i1.p1  ORF type:complete len:324 (+),score=63.65 TRINITY_DN23558_c0_g1_i1:48-1019(+)
MASALSLRVPLQKCLSSRILDESVQRRRQGCKEQVSLRRAGAGLGGCYIHSSLRLLQSRRFSVAATSSLKDFPSTEERCARRDTCGASESSGGPELNMPRQAAIDGDMGQQASETLLLSSAAIIIPMLAEGPAPGYSQASYYTSLGLFLLSLPGLWSLIKRSTASKVVRKTFVVPGPKVLGAKPLKVIAGEITAALAKSNFKIVNAGETITFEGVFQPNRGQAAFLTFCAAVGLASLALVLTIVAPDFGEGWYLITFISPAAGIYYWTRATRTEQIQIKMVTADDENETDVILQGDDEEIERVRKGLALMEKGKVYVKGLLET